MHCVQSGCIGPRCMDSTAFNHAAWNPLYSIRMHFNKLHGIHSVITLHGLRCIQLGSITPQCMESSAFNRDAFYQAAWNPLHSITLHGIHCIQSRCMESTAFNRDAFYQAAWNPCIHHTAWTPLYKIGIHCATMH